MQIAKFIEWKDRYNVGNSVIDTDHREITSIINDLYASIHNHSEQAEIRTILGRSLKYTLSHFDREERLLGEVMYPDLEKQKISHRHLAQKTKELFERYSQNENGIPLEAMSFLKNWWIDHIIVMDMRYKPYLEEIKKPSSR